MKLSKQLHHRIRLQNIVFTCLFLIVAGMIAWLSTRHVIQSDWTAGGRNTLSETSRQILRSLKEKVVVTAYTGNDPVMRDRINDLVNRYRRYKSDFTLTFVNPYTAPGKVRELGINTDGELVIEYQDRSEKVNLRTESAITNALQRLTLSEERWVLFATGHGERSLLGQKNSDLGQFGSELHRKGINLQPINLVSSPDIPDNTSLLVVAGPRADLLPGEVKLIENYLGNGGNLLWLLDSSASLGMESLTLNLGLTLLPGTVVDATTQVYGINDPSFALITEYPNHPITLGFDTLTVFPTAVGITIDETSDFMAQPLLTTLPRSWTEIGPIKDEIQFDADGEEREGPINIAIALSRGPSENFDPAVEQRIVVIGDGDFLSNRYLGNGDNLRLGINLVQWLIHDDHFIDIPPKLALDRTLEFSKTSIAVIGLGFLVVLPLTLFAIGGCIWYRRKNS